MFATLWTLSLTFIRLCRDLKSSLGGKGFVSYWVAVCCVPGILFIISCPADAITDGRLGVAKGSFDFDSFC